jgi:RNA 3'-terminal phosphate cyclase (ATP)
MASPGRTPEPVKLSGSEGSAGETSLRAALSLAAITQQPFVMTWSDAAAVSSISAATVEAARAILGGAAEGATVGSREIQFEPGPLKSGTFRAEAGACPLAPLVEMATVPLSLAGGVSQIRFSGITHAPGQPTFHDAALGWMPLVERVGIAAELTLTASGFEPDGDGVIDVRVFPAPRLRGLDIASRGLLVETQALALVANLGIGIALPLERSLSTRLRGCGIAAQVEVLPMPAERARGLAAVIVAQFERVRAAIVTTGQTGHPAEEVAELAVKELQQLLRCRGALPASTAEALLVPLALAASPHGAPGVIGKDPPSASHLTVSEVTAGMLTVSDVIRRMLPVEIQIQGLPGDEGAIDLRPRA